MKTVEEIERECNASGELSRRYRELIAAREASHRKRLRLVTPLAVIGLAILVVQITSDIPVPALVLLGMALVIPAMVEWTQG